MLVKVQIHFTISRVIKRICYKTFYDVDSFNQLHKSFTYDCRLQIHKHSSWHMLPRASLTEESVEGVIPTTNGLITRHIAIRLDTVLQAIQLPACIANLYSGLANMDGDALTLHKEKEMALNGCQPTAANRPANLVTSVHDG